ncbi:MAG: hypothetical protein A2161_17040 [Candidatus Schekmanbacteria bacterium RBG_13_48_7]|uniref:Uncharacterized protein n=1 Tax=Candidatus Schekmanbacteria bacterium RBG_13_48_7 TaxID=1817878 RepID=A0A1F7S5L3_9BACT|nr:MAG: hypothetical protein A2161_17040 [Candidatus Schekmanbacteria bacterium RBG_13_48_7]
MVSSPCVKIHISQRGVPWNAPASHYIRIFKFSQILKKMFLINYIDLINLFTLCSILKFYYFYASQYLLYYQ